MLRYAVRDDGSDARRGVANSWSPGCFATGRTGRLPGLYMRAAGIAEHDCASARPVAKTTPSRGNAFILLRLPGFASLKSAETKMRDVEFRILRANQT